jgi:hypothetical protein
MAMITDRIAHGFLRSYLRPSQAPFWVGSRQSLHEAAGIGRIALGSVVSSLLLIAPR